MANLTPVPARHPELGPLLWTLRSGELGQPIGTIGGAEILRIWVRPAARAHLNLGTVPAAPPRWGRFFWGKPGRDTGRIRPPHIFNAHFPPAQIEHVRFTRPGKDQRKKRRSKEIERLIQKLEIDKEILADQEAEMKDAAN